MQEVDGEIDGAGGGGDAEAALGERLREVLRGEEVVGIAAGNQD